MNFQAIRRLAGALVFERLPFEWRMLGVGRLPTPWTLIRNRNQRLTTDGRGVRCEWEFTSDLHVARVFPRTSARLMQRAFTDWPIALRDAPADDRPPLVSFIIGHRGVSRLPHLLTTLRSIAGQRDVPIECLVVEQAGSREIETSLPSWVRYIHTPIPTADFDYCRSWTLNVGARHARGRVLVLHDNDMLMPERYAAELLAAVDQGWEFLDLKRFTFYLTPADTEQVFATGELPTNANATVTQNLLGGATIAAEKDAYFRIGGFDEGFVGWGGEDNDFWERARTGRALDFGYLPFMHLFHAPQSGKIQGREAPAVKRYHDEIRRMPPQERIARLRAKESGRIDGPAL